MNRIYFVFGIVAAFVLAGDVCAQTPLGLTASADDLTGYIRITGKYPQNLPDVVSVEAAFHLPGSPWQKAAATRHRSQTARFILRSDGNNSTFGRDPNFSLEAEEMSRGGFEEHLAAGKQRTIVWHTDRQLPPNFRGDVPFRVRLKDESGKLLAEEVVTVKIDHVRQVFLEDFSRVAGVTIDKRDGPGWVWHRPKDGRPALLEANEQFPPIEPLSVPLDLKGYYALYVTVPVEPDSSIDLRLSGSQIPDRFTSCLGGIELFWRVAKMDGRRLVIHQAYRTASSPRAVNDGYRARLSRVRLVPLDEQAYQRFNRLAKLKHDKTVSGLFEIYSWAFGEYVVTNHKFMEPLAAFAEARIDRVDTQLGRLGMRAMYPSLVEAPLFGEAQGDPAPGGTAPRSNGGGRMVSTTHPWLATRRAAAAFGLSASANFGAGIAYPNHPVGSPIFADHPEWTDDSNVYPRYELDVVRRHFLAMYEEILKLGADAVTVDFCRYPQVSDSPQTTIKFLTELRGLTARYPQHGKPVVVRVRYPVEGVVGNNGQYRPKDWVEKNLVDVLMPSGVSANVLYFDCREIIKATRGSAVKVMPSIEGGAGGQMWPGGVVAQVDRWYREGADGITIYQADARVVGSMLDHASLGLRQTVIRYLGSSRAVSQMQQQILDRQDEFSTEIYLDFPLAYQSARVQAWVEGGQPQVVEFYIKEKLITKDLEPPFVMGKQGAQNNYPFIGEPLKLRV
ncbi:MAG: hypothetical protein U9N87_10725, partial [Planctomycetota bacterium]|nr:hypothetical protein [Planctomycetota bacterium]